MTANVFNIIAAHESSNGVNVNGPMTSSGQAQGLYQITTGTWSDFAPQAGYSLSQYPTPNSAPTNVQTAVASTIPLSRWATRDAVVNAYPGLNFDGMTLGQVASLTGSDPSQVIAAATPYQASGLGNDTSGQGYGSNGVSGSFTYSDPTTGQQLGSGSFGGTQPSTSTASGDADVGFAPGIYGGPQETGLSPGTAATVSGVGTTIGGAITGAGTAAANAITGVGTTFKNFFTGWIGSLENWVGRGFLILIGLVILAIALWRIVDPDGSKTQAIARNVEVAA